MSGIKKNYVHKNCFSSGNLFLDKIIGGFSIGSSVVIYEDTNSKIYTNFIKYFMGEGVVKDQQNIILHSDDTLCDYLINNIPYKSTQVESLLNAKTVSDLKNEEMKIAWRYENIKYSNLLEDVIKSSEYIFDISRPIQDTYKDKKKTISCNLGEDTFLKKLESLNKKLIKIAQENLFIENQGNEENENAPIKYLRIILPNLYDSEEINVDKDFNLIKQQLMAFKNIVRSLNTVALITINHLNLNNKINSLFKYIFDYVLTIKGFIMEDDRLEDYDGILSINKIPRINSLKMNFHNIEADTFGIIVEKRKIIIEQVDIGLEIDRNTKVKEKDVNKEKITINTKEIDF